MKKIAVIFALLALPAYAAEWVTTGNNPKFKTYVDTGTVVVKGSTRKVWELRDFATPQQGSFFGTYLSVKILQTYSCSARTVQMHAVVSYSGNMALGSEIKNVVLDEVQVDEISPGTQADNVLRAVCALS
jgi:hypothetical protein